MTHDANRAAAGGLAPRWAAGVLLALAAAVLVRAAGQPQDPLAAALEAGDADAAFALTPAIVEPGHRGWPRTVVGVNGRVTIRRPPQRLVTLSVGHDEIAFALLPPASRRSGGRRSSRSSRTWRRSRGTVRPSDGSRSGSRRRGPTS